MYQLVHRFAPESTRLRAALSSLLGVVTVVCVALIFVSHGLIVPVTAGVGLLGAALAVTLGVGLVNQAAGAPEEANPAWQPATPERESDADPIATLQQRYAEGELTDEEFERRMERLLDSDERSSAGRETAGSDERERELER